MKEITGFLVDVEAGDYVDFQYKPNQIADEKATAPALFVAPLAASPGQA